MSHFFYFCKVDKYKFRTYLKHRRRSKGRHSIHSPFLYNMYNTCVVKSNFKGDTFKSENDFGKRQAKKAHFINCFTKTTKIKLASALDDNSKYLLHYIESQEQIPYSGKTLSIIDAQNPIFDSKTDIESLLNTYGKNFIFIDRIHENKDATNNWNRLKSSNKITLCISFYHFGLISTNTDFAEQDFVLRF